VSVASRAAIGDNGDGGTREYGVRIEPDERRTHVAYDEAPGGVPRVSVRAAPADQARADAALRAVLAEGVLFDPRSPRSVVIQFEGDGASATRLTEPAAAPWIRDVLARLPELRGGEQNGVLILRAGRSVSDPSAVALIARVVRATFDEPLIGLEPAQMAQASLDAWTRSPQPPAPDETPGDEGDRRWLWGAALMLLGLEHVLRRGAGPGLVQPGEVPPSEARVA
jgi:hypothetical protein